MRTPPLVFIIIAIALLATLFFFARPLTSLSPNQNQTAGAGNSDQKEILLKVLHQYKNGAHVYVGELELPTPCHTIEAESVVLESYPEQVKVVLSTKEGVGICTQVVTSRKFKVAFQASKEANVSISFNGESARFEIEEAPPTLNLEAMPL